MQISSSQTGPAHTDALVVGAGIVGLAHAAEFVERGLSVRVVERDDAALGASIRNFGHVCATPQDGRALELAWVARQQWLRLGEEAGFEVRQVGTVVAARTPAELALVEEFAAARGGEQAVLLTADEVQGRIRLSTEVVGGVHLPLDLRVDPRAAIPAVAKWLAGKGVHFEWNAFAASVGDGVVRTPRATFTADHVVHAVGHDVDRLFPDLAAEYAVRRCRLHMLEVDVAGAPSYEPALLTGTSMLRYGGLAAMPSAAAVRAELQSNSPRLLEIDANVMLTQRPDGAVVLGDSHHYARHHGPFEDEFVSDLLLREGERILGRPVAVRSRWRGVYAHSTLTDFLVAQPDSRTTVVSVTSGIGMTTSFGLARSVVDDLI